MIVKMKCITNWFWKSLVCLQCSICRIWNLLYFQSFVEIILFVRTSVITVSFLCRGSNNWMKPFFFFSEWCRIKYALYCNGCFCSALWLSGEGVPCDLPWCVWPWVQDHTIKCRQHSTFFWSTCKVCHRWFIFYMIMMIILVIMVICAHSSINSSSKCQTEISVV